MLRLNTPNKLTVLRIILAPIFLAFMLIPISNHFLFALVIFIIASITDLLDGLLARKNDLVTDFGKFLDPLADKMLTTAAFICFIELKMGYGIAIITFIVILREFFITSLRLLAVGSGVVIAAGFMGKLKTVLQITAIIMAIFFEYIISYDFLGHNFVSALRATYSVFLWFSAILAVVSGVQYFIRNKQYLDIKK